MVKDSKHTENKDLNRIKVVLVEKKKQVNGLLSK